LEIALGSPEGRALSTSQLPIRTEKIPQLLGIGKYFVQVTYACPRSAWRRSYLAFKFLVSGRMVGKEEVIGPL
jgi:hypothetical protein